MWYPAYAELSLSLDWIQLVFFVYQGLVRIALEFFRGDIYFNNKRNWITFYASITSIMAGVLLYISGPFIDGGFFVTQVNENLCGSIYYFIS